MSDDKGEKTEQATDARREEFRKQGQVAQTRELATALSLLVSSGAIFMLSSFFFDQLQTLFNATFGLQMLEWIHGNRPAEALMFGGLRLAMTMAPVLLITAIVSISSTLIQVGFLDVEDALAPNFERISPAAGFKRLFSIRSLSEGIKSILKFSILGMVVLLILKGEVHKFPSLLDGSPQYLLNFMGGIVGKLLFGLGISMLVIAGFDYFFLRWDIEQKMMMSKQEVKDETKQREGDPMIKARVRRLQRAAANRRMMEAVPKASVVVTNPTHIAVALKYDDSLPAPQLLAKGGDLIAEKIKQIARENGIPIIENKPLARTIFKTLKIGQVIPRELFVAVAEVLSVVYKMKRRRTK